MKPKKKLGKRKNGEEGCVIISDKKRREKKESVFLQVLFEREKGEILFARENPVFFSKKGYKNKLFNCFLFHSKKEK